MSIKLTAKTDKARKDLALAVTRGQIREAKNAIAELSTTDMRTIAKKIGLVDYKTLDREELIINLHLRGDSKVLDILNEEIQQGLTPITPAQGIKKDLARTETNEERAAILEALDVAQLRTFAENEFIRVNKRLGKAKLIAEIAAELGGRFEDIDEGGSIYVRGFGGLPTMIETSLLQERKNYITEKSKATNETTVEDTPASNEEILQDMPAQELRAIAWRFGKPRFIPQEELQAKIKAKGFAFVLGIRNDIDRCNKAELISFIKARLEFEPAVSLDTFIIKSDEESKFVAGKVYLGDLGRRTFTIISRTAKTVMAVTNNSEGTPRPERCQILRQKNTEYITWGNEFIYSFNEDKEAQPVLLEPKKEEATVNFEIGKTYASKSFYADEWRYSYYTVIARTDKTVTFAESASLNPKAITLDGTTGNRVYTNDNQKPIRRNIEVYNETEHARIDCIDTLHAHILEDYYKRPAFDEGINETLDAEYSEIHTLTAPANVPALPAIDAEYKEVEPSQDLIEGKQVIKFKRFNKYIASNGKIYKVFHTDEEEKQIGIQDEISGICRIEKIEMTKNSETGNAEESITFDGFDGHFYEATIFASHEVITEENSTESVPVTPKVTNADEAIKALANVETPEQMREILEQLKHEEIELVAIREVIEFKAPQAHARPKANLIDGIIKAITYRNGQIYAHINDKGNEFIINNPAGVTPLVAARYKKHGRADFVEYINTEYYKALGAIFGVKRKKETPAKAEPVKENEPAYFDEEYYTDTHAYNSHPEQDIPEDHEPDTARPAKVAETIQPIAKTVENPDDLTEKLTGMKKAEIIAFAAQHKISLRSLKKNVSAKSMAKYVAIKYSMIKNAEAKAAATPKTNTAPEQRKRPVAQSLKPSTSNHTSTRIEGRQIVLVFEGQNYTFDFGRKAA